MQFNEKRIQILLILIGIILVFMGAVANSLQASDLVFSQVSSIESVHTLGWAMLMIGFPLFLYGIIYPYLEAWRRSKYSLKLE